MRCQLTVVLTKSAFKNFNQLGSYNADMTRQSVISSTNNAINQVHLGKPFELVKGDPQYTTFMSAYKNYT